jgi:hypothetical protein
MEGPTAETGCVGFGQGPINVSETGSELSYMMSRALGYAALVVSTLFVATQLF